MNAFLQEVFHTGIYKRNQGRVTRQVTFAAVAIAMAMGVYRLHQTMMGRGPWEHYVLPGVLLAIGLWLAYRLVNVPAFADFLIAVEAEMNKVSWPTRSELFRASLVVLITIFGLAAMLFLFDAIWRTLFQQLGVL